MSGSLFPRAEIRSNTGVFLHLIYVPKSQWRPEYSEAVFVAEGGYYQSGVFHPFGNGGSNQIFTKTLEEKMSKRLFNVVNPDDVISFETFDDPPAGDPYTSGGGELDFTDVFGYLDETAMCGIQGNISSEAEVREL